MTIPGWYGKLPTLGDFASRRLPAPWIETWDAWLAEELAGWRDQDPEHWLTHYLQGPSLRFLVMPGVMTEEMPQAMPRENRTAPESSQSWVGILMPSVDRVGRYFPLTLAQAVSHLPENAHELDRLMRWLTQLDDLAVAALQDDWTADQLEAQLHALEAIPAPDAAAPSTQLAQSGQFSTAIHGEPASLLWALARAPVLQSLHAKVLWWCDGAPGQQLLRITTGLPQRQDFSALLTAPFATTTAAAATTTTPPIHR